MPHGDQLCDLCCAISVRCNHQASALPAGFRLDLLLIDCTGQQQLGGGSKEASSVAAALGTAAGDRSIVGMIPNSPPETASQVAMFSTVSGRTTVPPLESLHCFSRCLLNHAHAFCQSFLFRRCSCPWWHPHGRQTLSAIRAGRSRSCTGQSLVIERQLRP